MFSRSRSPLSTEPTRVDRPGKVDRPWQETSVLALVVALFLEGCGGLGDSYVVQVDPHFTQDEQVTIVAALDSWEAAVPVHFVEEIEPCSGIHGGTICIHASDSATIAAKQSQPDGTGVGLTLRERTWGHVVDGAEIFIDVATVEESYAADFQRIAAHEIGHAMQLDHNAPGNLMAAMATEDAPTPTCADAAQWHEARSQSVPACPQ
jgi:Matrixin